MRRTTTDRDLEDGNASETAQNTKYVRLHMCSVVYPSYDTNPSDSLMMTDRKICFASCVCEILCHYITNSDV